MRDPAFVHAFVIPWYTDAALDAGANEFGRRVGDFGGDSADAMKNPVYANFAHGDESLEAIYGSSLPKLREVKKKWDLKGVFGQWFFIK
jgi:hypothetical protein